MEVEKYTLFYSKGAVWGGVGCLLMTLFFMYYNMAPAYRLQNTRNFFGR